MNYYQDQRRRAVLDLLDPTLTTDEVIDKFLAFVDTEVRKAYGRGLRDGENPRRPSRARRFDILGKPSAMRAGKMKPAQRERS